MRKLFTTFFVLFLIGISTQAQIAWDNIRATPYPYTQHAVLGADTLYFSMLNRSTGKAIAALPNDSVTALANDVNYAAADSLVWRIVKGAALGTTQRVRFINVKTGKYLYTGKKGGTVKRVYVADYNDPLNGGKDFTLVDKGQRVNAEYYYNIVDNEGSLLNNLSATATIGYGTSSNTGTSTYMFRFYSKKGPLPKADLLPSPTVEISTAQSILTVGGSVVLDIKVTKGTNDLLGVTKLYMGTTLLSTLSLDADGKASYTHNGLVKGNITFTAVYEGCANYTPQDKGVTYTVVADPTAKNTVVNLTAPASSEAHTDVTINIDVKTKDTNDIVPSGDVLVYVNNSVKNRVAIDALGTASLTFPNLLVGNAAIKAIYIGDEQYYLNSDSTKKDITITPSTSTKKPYPVYFDLCDQPEFRAWDIKRNVTTATTRPYSKAFTLDSLAGIVISDTLTQSFKVTYNLLGTTYSNSDLRDTYNRADNILLPLGSGRPKFVKFKTPWLNEGSYNIYLSYRVNSDPKVNMTSIKMDGKELYFPNEEMYGRWFRSWAGVNIRRQWNAKGHSGNMGMNYLGSVKVESNGSHSLRIDVADENGADYTLDMLQFIPVDMDSLSINLPAAKSTAKKYYPMFDWVGFARQSDFAAANVPTTYADITNFAIPYQVTDLTDWGTKYSHTIDSVGIKKRTIGTDDYVANYVTVYRAEDKWTRVSEGYADGTTFQYTCELPQGSYYYEAILFTDLADGSQGYRTFINSGTFSVGPGTGTTNTNSNRIKVYAANNKLSVIGIKAGASVVVTDITGRVVVNEKAKSDTYSKQLPKGLYVVKVVSGETVRTKVLVK